MIKDKPNSIVIQVGTNDILNHANYKDIARSIIYIWLDCKNNGVNEVFLSSILVKINPNITAIACQINDMLRNLREKNGSCIICDDFITTN